MTRRLAAVSALVVLVGCSSSRSIVITAPSTTAAVVQPTEPATTAPPATTPPTLAATMPTTEPATIPLAEPTTTVAVVTADTLVAVHEARRAAYLTCVADPAACDVGTLAIAGSPLAEGVAKIMSTLIEDGLRGRGNPEVDRAVYESVEIAPDALSARLLICTVDGGVLFDPRNPDDPGDDAIVNDAVASERSYWNYAFVEGRWQTSGGELLEKRSGDDLCGAG